jgi:hypothetical protein
MTKLRGKLIHFLALESGEPLCGGVGREVWRVGGNGVAICSNCARRVAEQAQRAAPRRVRAPPA